MAETDTTNSQEAINKENPQSNGALVERNERGQFVKGHKKLGKDRTGTKNKKKVFDEIFEEAIEEIEQSKELKIDNAERKLMVKAIIEGLKGNPHFWKAIAEWRYGKPKESLDLTSGGEPMGIIFLPRRKKDEDKQLEEPKNG